MALVLLVDDERSLRHTLAEFLQDAGHTVHAAEDAEQALALFGGHPFDVVVTDIILPRISGVELLQRLRERAPRVPVIMMTGEPTVESAIEAVRASAHNYLTKPIGKHLIQQAVAQAMWVKTLQDEKDRLEALNRQHQEELERLVEARTRSLRDSEALYHSLVESLPQGLYRKDHEGRYTFANARFCEALGRPLDAILGRTDADLRPAERAARSAEVDHRVGQTGKLHESVEQEGMAGQDARYLHVVRIPLQDGEGRRQGLQGLVWDITDRKQAELDIQRRNAELTTLNEIGQAMNRLAEPRELLELIREMVGRVLDNRNLYIALFDRERQEITFPVYTIHGEQRAEMIRRAPGNGLTEYVLRTRTPLLLRSEVNEAMVRLGIDLIGEPCESFLAVPLLRGDEAVGVIGVQDYERANAFDERHAALLTTIAAQASSVLDNARLYAQARQEIAERQRAENVQRCLYQISEAVQQAGDQEDLFRAIHQHIARLMPAENLYIALYDAGTDQVSFPYFADAKDTCPPPQPAAGTLTGYVIRTRRPFLASAATLEPLVASGQVRFRGTRSPNWLGAPLLVGERVIGVIAVQRYEEGAAYGPGEMELLQFVSAQVALAIERKRAEQARLETERHLALILQAVPLVLYTTRVPSPYAATWITPNVERITGFALEPFLRQPGFWHERLHPEDRARVETAFADPSRPREFQLEYRWRCADGAYRWFLDQLVLAGRDSDDRAELSGIWLDITERRRVEEALRRSQADLERAQAVGHLGSWISEVQPPGELAWSAETCRIFGVPPDQFDRRSDTFFNLIHPEDRAAVRAASQAAHAGERDYEIEHRIVRPDGSVRWVYEKAEVERDAANRPLRMVGVVQDVTERRMLEDQLRQSQKLESIGQLAAGVAHDFNNLLTVISGNASLLLSDLGEPSEHARTVKEIIEASQRAANLTRQLLLFSRKQQLQPQSVNLNDLASNLSKMLRRMLNEDVALEVRYASDLPLVVVDPGMIEQVILNLAVNARDAMPKGGRLLLATATETLAPDQPPLSPDAQPGTYVRLSVTDTGCGIPPEIRERIFEPFFTTKEVGKGTGLGLATVYGIVRQHRGWIDVESTVGKGSSFRIHLPAAPASAPAADTRETPVSTVGRGETILVVEDDAPVRDLICRILTGHGYKVVVAGSGAEARRLPQATWDSVNLLLTDMVMPGGLSGRELAEAAWRTRPGMRVIFFSGYSPEMAGGRLQLQEGVTFLQKPCSPSQLLNAIAGCLRG